jgi:hypothetical protein
VAIEGVGRPVALAVGQRLDLPVAAIGRRHLVGLDAEGPERVCAQALRLSAVRYCVPGISSATRSI